MAALDWARLRTACAATLTAVGLGVAVVLSPGAGTAHADALDDLAQEYTLGTSGGQISNLTRSALQLRAQGAPISENQNNAIKAALDKRPNQMPLINTLKGIVAGQTQFLKNAKQQQKQPVNIAVGPINGQPGNPSLPPGAYNPATGLPNNPNQGRGIGAGSPGVPIIDEHVPIAGTG